MERYGQDDKWKKGRRDRLIVSTINSVLSKLSLSLLSISRVDLEHRFAGIDSIR